MNNPGEYHGPTLTKAVTPLSPRTWNFYDYEDKRLAALRAMRTKPIPGTLRVPQNSWSGYGVSHTSPGVMFDKYKMVCSENNYDTSAFLLQDVIKCSYQLILRGRYFWLRINLFQESPVS